MQQDVLEFALIYFQDGQKLNCITLSSCLKINFSELKKDELLLIGDKNYLYVNSRRYLNRTEYDLLHIDHTPGHTVFMQYFHSHNSE